MTKPNPPTDAEMLQFLLNQFSAHSLKMDGSHSWRHRTGWPWTHAKGPTIRDAVIAAMAEVECEKGKPFGL